MRIRPYIIAADCMKMSNSIQIGACATYRAHVFVICYASTMGCILLQVNSRPIAHLLRRDQGASKPCRCFSWMLRDPDKTSSTTLRSSAPKLCS